MFASVHTSIGHITGISVGGVYTSMVARKYRVGFDVGMPIIDHVGIKTLCLSHVHSDHIGGLLAFVGARDLVNQSSTPLQILVPASEVAMVESLLHVGSELARYKLRAVVQGMLPGDMYSIGQNVSIQAFRTDHVVPSLGYAILERVTKLRPEFVGQDIAQLKKTMPSEDLFTHSLDRRLSYITDSSSKVFDLHPEVLDSDVLICESTYIDDKYNREAVDKYGHMHVDAVVEASQAFTGGNLVLMHFSKKYSRHDIVSTVVQKFKGSRFDVCDGSLGLFLHNSWE